MRDKPYDGDVDLSEVDLLDRVAFAHAIMDTDNDEQIDIVEVADMVVLFEHEEYIPH